MEAMEAVEIRKRTDQPAPELVSRGDTPSVRVDWRTQHMVLPTAVFHIKLIGPTQEQPRPTSVLVGSLNDRSFRVAKAIPVNIEDSSGAVIASWSEIDEFGTGASMTSAIADLGRTVAELYRSLDDDKDRLGPDLERVWHLLQQYLVPRDENSRI